MFKVGDLAVVVRSSFFPEYTGTVCQIIEPYEGRTCVMPDGTESFMFRFVVRMHDGRTGAISFRNLRHINPPDESSSWDECAFDPTRLQSEVSE